MKNVLYTLSDGEICLNYNRNTYAGLYTKHLSLKVLASRPKKQDALNYVLLNPLDYFKLDCLKATLVNLADSTGMEVRVYVDDTTPVGRIVISNRVRTILSLVDDQEIALGRYQEETFGHVTTQRVEDIKKNVIIVSPAVHKRLTSLANGKILLYQLYNQRTGDNIILKSDHIIVDEDKTDDKIGLTRKQRIVLGLETGSTTSDEPVLKLVPVCDSISYLKRKSIWGSIVDFYVGKSTISLRCTRPYENDEGADVVRLSPANMKLLGVEEMDKVILRYKNKSKKCRVLPLEDKEEFFKTNAPTSIDLSIGVPAHVRNELGVYDLNSSIKVDRDTSFILRRSINEQIVPILLTVFSSKALAGNDIWISVLLSLLAIPIVTYLNLSSKRNMRV